MTTGLASKLGIQAGDTVCTVNENSDTVAELKRETADAVTYLEGTVDGCDVMLVWLAPSYSASELLSVLRTKIKPDGRIWIIIPRQEVAERKGIKFDWKRIQAQALEGGLVDNKVASINDEEYGTQFVLRKELRN